MAIQSSAILTTGSTIFTCPGTPSTDEQEHAVTCIMFCNNSNSTIDLTMHIVNPSPDAISNTNMVINELPIPAGETFSFDTEKVVLATGDRVIAVSTTNPVGYNPIDAIPVTTGAGLHATVSSMRVS